MEFRAELTFPETRGAYTTKKAGSSLDYLLEIFPHVGQITDPVFEDVDIPGKICMV